MKVKAEVEFRVIGHATANSVEAFIRRALKEETLASQPDDFTISDIASIRVSNIRGSHE